MRRHGVGGARNRHFALKTEKFPVRGLFRNISGFFFTPLVLSEMATSEVKIEEKAYNALAFLLVFFFFFFFLLQKTNSSEIIRS